MTGQTYRRDSLNCPWQKGTKPHNVSAKFFRFMLRFSNNGLLPRAVKLAGWAAAVFVSRRRGRPEFQDGGMTPQQLDSAL
jgi:hypothetical protein